MVTEDELKRLPLRAIVAFAARCARRVQPLFHMPDGQPTVASQTHEDTIERAITAAESFAGGADVIRYTIEAAAITIEAAAVGAAGDALFAADAAK